MNKFVEYKVVLTRNGARDNRDNIQFFLIDKVNMEINVHLVMRVTIQPCS